MYRYDNIVIRFCVVVFWWMMFGFTLVMGSIRRAP